MSDRQLYEGLVPKDPNELGRGTMTHEELVALQGKNGEIYRGMKPANPNELGRGTMTHEELVALQGKNGEIYRGMKPANPNELGRGTMTHEEFIALQGKNGEIYRGMKEEDPDKYRLRTTGTADVELSKLVDDLIRTEELTPQAANLLVTKLIQEPKTINTIIERRYRKTSDFLYSYGDWDKRRIQTDLQIIAELIICGYDFTTFQINPDYLVGSSKTVDFMGFLEHYMNGLKSKMEDGKNATIVNPLNPSEMVNADEFIGRIKEYYSKFLQTQKEESTLNQEHGPRL